MTCNVTSRDARAHDRIQHHHWLRCSESGQRFWRRRSALQGVTAHGIKVMGDPETGERTPVRRH